MKIKLPTFSSLNPCLNQVQDTYGRLQSAIFIIFFSFTWGLFFPWDFRVQPLSVSCGVSECSLYTVPISDATEGLGEYSYPCDMHIPSQRAQHPFWFVWSTRSQPGFRRSWLLVQPKAKGEQGAVWTFKPIKRGALCLDDPCLSQWSKVAML